MNRITERGAQSLGAEGKGPVKRTEMIKNRRTHSVVQGKPRRWLQKGKEWSARTRAAKKVYGIRIYFPVSGDFPVNAFEREELEGPDCQELGRVVREEVEAVSVV